MNTALVTLATLCGLAALVAVAFTGLRQPSRRIYRHDTVIFAALRQDKLAVPFVADDALWRSQVLFTLVGEGDAYWTDYLILPPDTLALSRLKAHSGLSDMFVAEVEMTPVPTFALGVLRLRHRLGLTRRPQGALPVTLDHVEGRREVLPTIEAIARAQALPPSGPVTMVNFLEYYAIAKGDAVDGRAAYLRYGREAFKAVHAVGGQFLFAGTITTMLVAPRSPAWQRPWDDVAAMIYPDPTAIFAMEQLPTYRRALGHRDVGLKRTRVIATRAN